MSMTFSLSAFRETRRFYSLRTAIYRIAILGLAFATPGLKAQIVPNCDVTCSGAGPTANVATISARGAITADRGAGKAFASARIAGALTKQGSQSFTYAVPLVSLPGRGLNLNLALYYNSFIWTSSGNTINFDLDRDTHQVMVSG